MDTSHLTAFIGWLRVERGYSPHTVDAYTRDVTEFFKTVGDDIPLAAISRDHVQSYLSSLYSANSSSSVARKMSALRTFFRYLCRQGTLSDDPFAGVAGPKLGRHIPVFLTVDEVFSLLEEPG
jgi:integrase/recombinase XerC